MSKLEVYPLTFKIEGVGEAEGELHRIKAPHTAEEIWYALPISSRIRSQDNAHAYFQVNFQVKAEKPTHDVKPGEICYAPMSKSVHIIYDEVRPYQEMNVVGKITKGLEIFKELKLSKLIVVEKRDK